jgi:putative transposase
METFFDEEDYKTYITLMGKWCRLSGIEVWAYCLMPNHIHIVGVPENEVGLAQGIGEAHRRYTRYINFKKGWKGYLWQGRFSSFPMDEEYLLAAVRYIELNPVRAKIVSRATDYRWSSARAHSRGENDEVVTVKPMLERVSDWSELLACGELPEFADMRRHERTGRPLGKEGFVEKISTVVGRRKRGQSPLI